MELKRQLLNEVGAVELMDGRRLVKAQNDFITRCRVLFGYLHRSFLHFAEEREEQTSGANARDETEHSRVSASSRYVQNLRCWFQDELLIANFAG